MNKLATFGAAAALLAAVPLAAQDPAALVLRVQGDVNVSHAGAAPSPAAVGERMFVGDEVLPGSGARAVLITRTGAQQVVTQRTTVEAPSGGGNPDMFQRVLATLQQAASTDATMGGRQGMIRPVPGKTILVAPLNTLTVSSTRPTFTWTATPGMSYELQLRNVAGGSPQYYEVGTDTTWTLPESEPALEEGATYAWTVFPGGRRGGRPQPQQEFRVIGLEASVELETLVEEIGVFGLDPFGDGLFLTAVVYRDMDLFYDALDAMVALEKQGAMTADLYMMKGEILANMGWEAQARAAFDRADELMR